MTKTTADFLVSIAIPKGVTVKDMVAFIDGAVRTECGYDPDLDVDRSSIRVKALPPGTRVTGFSENDVSAALQQIRQDVINNYLKITEVLVGFEKWLAVKRSPEQLALLERAVALDIANLRKAVEEERTKT